MKLIANTDDGQVKIDPEKVLQFWAVSGDKPMTMIEHETDGEKQTHCVNHDIHQIATCIFDLVPTVPVGTHTA